MEIRKYTRGLKKEIQEGMIKGSFCKDLIEVTLVVRFKGDTITD